MGALVFLAPAWIIRHRSLLACADEATAGISGSGNLSLLRRSAFSGLGANDPSGTNPVARNSTYADVLTFLDSLERSTRDLRAGTLALSAEGRKVPFLVAARPLVSGPAEAHRTGKPIVYLQANIHAGEVEGKEATQMLLRAVTQVNCGHCWTSLVLLVVPIYNPDGNERFGPPVTITVPGRMVRSGGPKSQWPVAQSQSGLRQNGGAGDPRGRGAAGRPGTLICSSTSTPPTAAITATS